MATNDNTNGAANMTNSAATLISAHDGIRKGDETINWSETSFGPIAPKPLNWTSVGRSTHHRLSRIHKSAKRTARLGRDGLLRDQPVFIGHLNI